MAFQLDFRSWRRRQAMFIAAGPAASLLAGAVALALGGVLLTWIVLGPAASSWGFAGAEFLVFFGGWSLVLGLLNLLPFSTKSGQPSDGGLLRSLRYPSAEAPQ